MFYGSSRGDREDRTNKKKTDGDSCRQSTGGASADRPVGGVGGISSQQILPGAAPLAVPPPRETDPLLGKSGASGGGAGGLWTTRTILRSRRAASKSPPVITMQQPQEQQQQQSTEMAHRGGSAEDRNRQQQASADGDDGRDHDSIERQRQALSPPRADALMQLSSDAEPPPPSTTSNSSSSQQQHPPASHLPFMMAEAANQQPLLSESLPVVSPAAAAGAVELNRRGSTPGSPSGRAALSSPPSFEPAARATATGPPPPPLDKTYSLSSSSASASSQTRGASQSHRRLRPVPSYGSSSPATHNHPSEPKDAAPAAAPSAGASASSASASSGGRPRHHHPGRRSRGSSTKGRFAASGAGGAGLGDAAGAYKGDHGNEDADDDTLSRQTASSYQSSSHVASPILEIPEEVYQVRKSALQVLKPLTKTWVVMSVGFALTALFGTSRWTRLMPGLPFWFILLPAWLAHAGLLLLHVQSAQNLSVFIAAANESRQRGDSRDQINRTEYLPLLQRSLKLGLKTGLLSFVMFCFEILIYVRVAKSSISLAVTFLPLWFLVAGGLADGIVCKTQHWLRVACWVLVLAAMVLVVLKVDHGLDSLRWRTVISPIILVLSIASGTLMYIVYGHQVGYYRLTESQLTAGNLYSLAALICIVLMIMLGEVIPLSRPVEVESRLFVVILAPLVISLVGMGAWVVSRDEYARLLLYGGQAAVHPMRLRWEDDKGWTCIQGQGVVTIPMFGEVSFQPLERKALAPTATTTSATERALELMTCCSGLSCYPYEEDDEETVRLTEDPHAYLHHHPYLDPLQSRTAYRGA